MVLVAIAIPSLRLLYIIDDIGTPSMTVKSVGHQWYWSYEYSDFFSSEIDSYMVPSPLRLLDCDNRLLLAAQTPIRVLVTSADVLHSWTVPVLGIKADAVPGRLNQLSLFRDRAGVFFGQCSEICGRNHRFIPIAVEVLILQCYVDTARGLVNEIARRLFPSVRANCNECIVCNVDKRITVSNKVMGDLCQHTGSQRSNRFAFSKAWEGDQNAPRPTKKRSFCSLILSLLRCCVGGK